LLGPEGSGRGSDPLLGPEGSGAGADPLLGPEGVTIGSYFDIDLPLLPALRLSALPALLGDLPVFPLPLFPTTTLEPDGPGSGVESDPLIGPVGAGSAGAGRAGADPLLGPEGSERGSVPLLGPEGLGAGFDPLLGLEGSGRSALLGADDPGGGSDFLEGGGTYGKLRCTG